MKKMIALLLVVCVMCSMLIVTASAAEPRSMMRVETVTKRAANVRKYPNTNSLVYGNLMTLGSTERLAWKRRFMRNLGISPDMWQVAILDTKIKKL